MRNVATSLLFLALVTSSCKCKDDQGPFSVYCKIWEGLYQSLYQYCQGLSRYLSPWAEDTTSSGSTSSTSSSSSSSSSSEGDTTAEAVDMTRPTPSAIPIKMVQLASSQNDVTSSELNSE
ncbi:hypothetical protein J6590_036833 [Homalodisca vitripennis]|nr:hypothetical protein J6590_036833 [Homalodisca vitripennis]